MGAAAAGKDAVVRVYDETTGKQAATLDHGDDVTCCGHSNTLHAVNWKPDDPNVSSHSLCHGCSILMQTGAAGVHWLGPLSGCPGSSSTHSSLFATHFLQTSFVTAQVLVSGGWDRCVNIWDLRLGRAVRSVSGPYICGGDNLDIRGEESSVSGPAIHGGRSHDVQGEDVSDGV
eukprot:scaffold2622_cov20-Tisochrysis_lutea.AAC.1